MWKYAPPLEENGRGGFLVTRTLCVSGEPVSCLPFPGAIVRSSCYLWKDSCLWPTFSRFIRILDWISNHRYLFLTETIKSITVSLISGRPSTWSQIYQNAVSDFFRSDHYRFWNADPSLPAVFLTDSGDFRGYMQQCYHEDCDDMSHVTSKRLEFLLKTAQSLVEVASSTTNEKCPGKVVRSFFFNLGWRS